MREEVQGRDLDALVEYSRTHVNTTPEEMEAALTIESTPKICLPTSFNSIS